VGDTRFHCWKKGGHGSLDMKGGLKNSCDVFFYDAARRAGIDAVAAAANIFGLGVDLDIDLPGARRGLIPDAAWRAKHRRHWGVGDTIGCGIGQGVILATPLQLATYVSRIATGRAVQPHVTRVIGGEMQPGGSAADYPLLDVPELHLALARAGMFAVVNEAGGTATIARLNNWRERLGPARCGGCRDGCASMGISTRRICRGSSGRMRCSFVSRRMMRRVMRCRW
jgi:penicillin-binding protein 2